MTSMQKSFITEANFSIKSKQPGELLCSIIDFGARRDDLLNDDKDWNQWLKDNKVKVVEKPFMVDFYLC